MKVLVEACGSFQMAEARLGDGVCAQYAWWSATEVVALMLESESGETPPAGLKDELLRPPLQAKAI